MDIKIRAEVIENREVYRSSIKPEVSSLRVSVRFIRLTRQERVKSHITSVWSEGDEFSMGSVDINRILREN